MTTKAPKTKAGIRAKALRNVMSSKNFIVIGDKSSLMAIELRKDIDSVVEISLMRNALQSFRKAIDQHIKLLDENEAKLVAKPRKNNKRSAKA